MQDDSQHRSWVGSAGSLPTSIGTGKEKHRDVGQIGISGLKASKMLVDGDQIGYQKGFMKRRSGTVGMMQTL